MKSSYVLALTIPPAVYLFYLCCHPHPFHILIMMNVALYFLIFVISYWAIQLRNDILLCQDITVIANQYEVSDELAKLIYQKKRYSWNEEQEKELIALCKDIKFAYETIDDLVEKIEDL